MAVGNAIETQRQPYRRSAQGSFIASLATAFVFVLLGSLSSQAQAGTYAVQKVTVERGSEKANVRFVWFIEPPKFRLVTHGSAGKTHYLFNGRTFYVCSRFAGAKKASFTKVHGASSKILKSGIKGICQTAPSNFMTRFFISPLAAVTTVDTTDGMKLTLSLDELSAEKAKGDKEKAKVAGRVCKRTNRSYQITKADDKNTRSASEETEGHLCTAKKPHWRSGFEREVQKTIMRQPGGIPAFQALKKSPVLTTGFPLRGRLKTNFKSTESKKPTQIVRTLATKTLKDTEFKSKNVFTRPSGYELLTAGVWASSDAAKKASGKEGSKKDEASPLETVKATFFCALAGALGCFAP